MLVHDPGFSTLNMDGSRMHYAPSRFGSTRQSQFYWFSMGLPLYKLKKMLNYIFQNNNVFFKRFLHFLFFFVLFYFCFCAFQLFFCFPSSDIMCILCIKNMLHEWAGSHSLHSAQFQSISSRPFFTETHIFVLCMHLISWIRLSLHNMRAQCVEARLTKYRANTL